MMVQPQQKEIRNIYIELYTDFSLTSFQSFIWNIWIIIVPPQGRHKNAPGPKVAAMESFSFLSSLLQGFPDGASGKESAW